MTEQPSKPEPTTKQKVAGGVALGVVAVLLVVIVTSLVGGGDEEPAPAASATSTVASSTAAATTAEVTALAAEPVAGDVTAQMQAAAGGVVTAAEQTEPDRIEVQTTIVDPRGGTSGTPEAQQAIAVCQAAVQLLTAQGVTEPHVSVYESNGTSYVLAGHPSYGPDCTEV